MDFTRFIAWGGLFAALQGPDYFVRRMSILRGGIGLTWPNEVEFSADGSRHDAFPDESIGEYDEPAAVAAGSNAARQAAAPK